MVSKSRSKLLSVRLVRVEKGRDALAGLLIMPIGFDVAFRPRFPVIGRNGVDLRDKWAHAAEGYLGVSCPDMPNWVTFLGPNW